MNPYYTVIAQRANHRCEYCKLTAAVLQLDSAATVKDTLFRQSSSVES